MNTHVTARRRWWIAPVVVAALLVVATGVGVARPGNLVVLGWLDRPFLFGTLALLLLALAVCLAVREWVPRFAASGVLALFALGWAMLGWLTLPLRDDLTESSRHPSPDGTHELVLYDGMNIIDPTWELRLRSGDGLTTREWDLGCVNSDIENLDGVEWLGPHELRVVLAGEGAIDIVLDPSTGQPSTEVSAGC